MANYRFEVPVPQGGEQLVKEWIEQNFVKNVDHERVFRSAGISGERVWTESTPVGTSAVVSFDVKDPVQAFGVLGSSVDSWAVGFRELISMAHRLDYLMPAPPKELLVDWFEAAYG